MVRDGQSGSPDIALLRYAMQSVYAHSFGRRWQISGAPAVLVPPQVRPMGLAEALDVLRRWPARWNDAIWAVVRSEPIPPKDDAVANRYPVALVDAVGPDWLADITARRRHYRLGADVLAAALVARADGHDEVADQLIEVIDTWTVDPNASRRQTSKGQGVIGIVEAMEEVFGPANASSARDFVSRLVTQSAGEGSAEDGRKRFGSQLHTMESQLGQSVHDFVVDFADAAAFQAVPPPAGSGGPTLAGAPRPAMTVSPVSTSISQGSTSLTTTATVTTVVRGELKRLAEAVDPRRWPASSDVIRSTALVDDVFSLRPVEDGPPIGEGWEQRLVLEHAGLSWGTDNTQQGRFEVVLNTSFAVRDDGLSLRYSLARSIKSSVLWDRGPGGLLIDNGFIVARPLPGENTWRVTSRKVVRFSDRTPQRGGAGWLDTGQMINFLAPAAIAWWVESELYSLESEVYGTAGG